MQQKSTIALTSDQVRQRLRRQGKTVTAWAAEHGFRRQEVYRVMGGQSKAIFGRGHEIAVALGMKIPAVESTDSVAAGNLQDRRVA